MQHSDIINAWNQLADEYNQWDNLGEDEKVEFAYKLGHVAGQNFAADAMVKLREIVDQK